jgi:hypothetical protein
MRRSGIKEVDVTDFRLYLMGVGFGEDGRKSTIIMTHV